ncbi:MAG: electron transfer flavoprotein subunit alpha/FixB family protein [Alphaproteobacteria bacterium]|nr:MAG: electron transfer flavoprotein subunit alpha/FixB family protein [Alphaproteobacteria bacterium]
MSILVIAEHNNQSLLKSSLCAIGAAAQLGEAHVLILGANCSAAADHASKINGVKKVLVQDNVVHQNFLAESAAPVIAEIAKNYTHVIAPASSFGKNILARVAAALDVQPISDVIKIHSADTFDRPIYAGNAIATVQSSDAIKLLSVRPTAFAAAGTGGNAPIENISIAAPSQALSEFVSREVSKSERPDLGSARIIVSGGRGLGSAENFKLIEKIADKLGAAIGASRAAVDAGFVPNDYQVGQTGKIVAPELYIAVGISGAIQHLAGMKDSKIIVAINKDGEAPIFQIADYGLVGDLFAILPELQAALEKAKH